MQHLNPTKSLCSHLQVLILNPTKSLCHVNGNASCPQVKCGQSTMP